MKPRWEVWFRTDDGDTHKTIVTDNSYDTSMTHRHAEEYVFAKYHIQSKDIRELRVKFLKAGE